MRSTCYSDFQWQWFISIQNALHNNCFFFTCGFCFALVWLHQIQSNRHIDVETRIFQFYFVSRRFVIIASGIEPTVAFLHSKYARSFSYVCGFYVEFFVWLTYETHANFCNDVSFRTNVIFISKHLDASRDQTLNKSRASLVSLLREKNVIYKYFCFANFFNCISASVRVYAVCDFMLLLI